MAAGAKGEQAGEYSPYGTGARVEIGYSLNSRHTVRIRASRNNHDSANYRLQRLNGSIEQCFAIMAQESLILPHAAARAACKDYASEV
jgi:hypothetical protein